MAKIVPPPENGGREECCSHIGGKRQKNIMDYGGYYC